MKKRVKDFLTFLVSFILVGAISYTAVHIYQYFSLYGEFSKIPLETLRSLTMTIGPVFILLFLVVVYLLISRTGEKAPKKSISLTGSNSKKSNFYSLDLPEDEVKEEADLAEVEAPPLREEVEPEPEKVFSFRSSQVFSQTPEPITPTPEPVVPTETVEPPKPEPVVERKPETVISREPVERIEEDTISDTSTVDERKIFSEDLTSDEIDFLNREVAKNAEKDRAEARGEQPVTSEPVLPVYPHEGYHQPIYPNAQNIQYIPVYTQPIIYQQGYPVYQQPYNPNGQPIIYQQQPPVAPPVNGEGSPAAPIMPSQPEPPVEQQSPVYEKEAPAVEPEAVKEEPKVPTREEYVPEETRTEQLHNIREEAERSAREEDIRHATEKGKIREAYIPPQDTKFIEDKNFYDRLRQEVEYSNKKKYEVSLILLNLEPRKYDNDFSVFDDAVREFFDESAFIFEYVQSNTFAVILPFFSYFEAQKEVLNLYDFLKKELIQRSTSFKAGFTSKFNRYVDSETVLYETEVAFKKALEENEFCILGFEPDVNKYDQYYTT